MTKYNLLSIKEEFRSKSCTCESRSFFIVIQSEVDLADDMKDAREVHALVVKSEISSAKNLEIEVSNGLG